MAITRIVEYKRRDPAEQESKNNAKQQDETEVGHLFPTAALQKSAALFLAVQQVVDDVGVNLNSHVGRARALERRSSNIPDAYRRRAHQHNLVAEGFRRERPAHHIPHRILRISPVWPGVVDQRATVSDVIDDVRTQFDVVQAIWRHVGDHLLVRDFFVEPHRLTRQRRIKILFFVADH